MAGKRVGEGCRHEGGGFREGQEAAAYCACSGYERRQTTAFGCRQELCQDGGQCRKAFTWREVARMACVG